MFLRNACRLSSDYAAFYLTEERNFYSKFWRIQDFFPKGKKEKPENVLMNLTRAD